MREVIDQLPKAIRWSNIVMWFNAVLTVLLLLGGVAAMFSVGIPQAFAILLFTLFFGVQFRLLRNYKNACQEAFVSESAADIEEACRRQRSLVKFYGILTLIVITLAVVGIIAAVVIPVLSMM